MMSAFGLTTTLEAAAPGLLELFVRGALLLAIGAAAAWAMRGASASVRHLVWASALWALLVLPLASLSLPDIALRVLPASSPAAPRQVSAAPATATDGSNDVAIFAGADAAASMASRSAPPAASGSARSHAETTEPSWSWTAAAVAVWAIGTVTLLVVMIRSRLRLRRLAGGAWRLHDPAWWRAAARIGNALGLRRPVLLLATRRTRVPLTWGTRTPIVLLPADATAWPAERREAVLVHELAHVARGDALGHEIARVAAALFWPNPLVWIAVRMMRAERERACDDLVLATGTRASSYAGDLLEIARTVRGQPHLAAAALAMARPSELEGRLLAILDPRVPRRPVGKRMRAAAAILSLTMIVPLAALRPAERAPVARGTALPRHAAVIVPRLTTPGAPSRAAAPSRLSPPAAPARATLPPVAPPSGPAPIAAEMPNADVQAVPSVENWSVEQPPARPSDLETLIAVARAAAGLTNDDDAAGLLLDVLARGVRDATLQAEVLRSARTIGSGHHRRRVLIALMGTGLLSGTEPAFLGAAEGITSTHDRTAVLSAFAGANGLTNREVRTAFLRAATGVTSTHQRAQLLAQVIQLPEFGAAAAIEVLPAIRAMTSSHEKGNLLVALARRGVAEDPAVREAFLAAAASLSSDSDYVRAVRAAGLSGADRER